jgi:hypothetical protein
MAERRLNQPVNYRNVILKALLLFLGANLLFALLDPLPALGKVSAYNRLFPGRMRLPYGENPDKAYNLSLFQLEGMLASHEIAAGPKPEGEYRVIFVGDSATWGFLLGAEQTLTAYLNAAGTKLPDGRRVRAYNLGYPVMSLAKDLLILSEAMRYDPDLIVWPLTLESFPYDKQLFAPLLQHNREKLAALIDRYGLRLDPDDPGLIRPGPWEKTLIGQRRALADLARLQLYGVMWAATGIDQDLPENFTPRMEDLPAEEEFHGLQPPHLPEEALAFEILEAGRELAGETPVLLINEPMFISQGENSDIRYNFYYPRWAYDDYRAMLSRRAQAQGWHYRDLWELVPPGEFTNSAVHMSPAGTELLAREVGRAILELAAGK